MHKAARSANLEAVTLLLAAGAKTEERSRTGYTALHLAVYGRHVAVVEALLARGASINSQTNALYTPLHIAAEEQNVEVVRLFASSAEIVGKFPGFWEPS